MNNIKLFPSTEIIGAMACDIMNAEQIKAFALKPETIIASLAEIDVSNLDITVVENSKNDVNIVLPYYSQIETMQAEMLKDESLNNISGGEILISVGITAGLGIGLLIAKAVSAGASVAIAGGLVGAAIGASVVASVAGGVIAGVEENEQKGKK